MNYRNDTLSPYFTDEDFNNAEKYAKLATEQEKYKLAKTSNFRFFKALKIRDTGREGWIENGVYLEKDQPVTGFLKIEIDPEELDCDAISCFPNDPSKYSSSSFSSSKIETGKGEEEEDRGKSVACDFWSSKETEVTSGGISFKACQSACFEMNMEINKESGKPVPRGSLYIHKKGENFCRAINDSLLIFATIPESRFSASGKKIQGYNTRDVPPFKITDETFSRFEITYEYCKYFKQEFDSVEKDCYVSTSSKISELFFGRVITNFFIGLGSSSKVLRESLPRFTTKEDGNDIATTHIAAAAAQTTARASGRGNKNSNSAYKKSSIFEKLNVPSFANSENEKIFVTDATNDAAAFSSSNFPFSSKLLKKGISFKNSAATAEEYNNGYDPSLNLEGVCGEVFAFLTNLIIKAENLGYTEAQLKKVFLAEIDRNSNSGSSRDGVRLNSQEKEREELKVWIDIFFRFRHFLLDYFNKYNKPDQPYSQTQQTQQQQQQHRSSNVNANVNGNASSFFERVITSNEIASSEKNNFSSSLSFPAAASWDFFANSGGTFDSAQAPVPALRPSFTNGTTNSEVKTDPNSKNKTFENFYPRYSLKMIKMPSKIEKTDFRPMRHVPQKENQMELFWQNPHLNIGMAIWRDLVSIFTQEDFVWQNNIFVTLAADTAVDMALSRSAKLCKKLVEKLSKESIQNICSKAGRYGSRAAGRIISKSLVSFAGGKLTAMIVTSAVRTSLQMLKLLATFASMAFNVAAVVLTVVSIIGFILDLVFKQEWLNEKRSKDDLENYIVAYRTFFKEKMKLVDSETAPFTPKDIIDYIIDAQMRKTASIKSKKDEKVDGKDGNDNNTDTDDDWEEKENLMFDETTDEIYIKHYSAYLNGRTVNSFGQPIFPTQTEADFDEEKLSKKIKKDVNDIFNAGIFYCDIIKYNASRLPFLTLDEYEERYLKNKIEDRNRTLTKVSKNLSNALAATSFCIAFTLMFLSKNLNDEKYFYSLLSVLFLTLSFFFALLLLLLMALHKIDANNATFYSATRLFDFDIEDDYESKGALEKIRIHKKVSEFNLDFLRPFNEEMEKRYSKKGKNKKRKNRHHS